MYLASPRPPALTSGFNPSQHPSTSQAGSPPSAEQQASLCSSENTKRIGDEHERRVRENAKSRETPCARSHLRVLDSQRLSSGTVLDIIKSYHGDSYASPKVPTSSPVSTLSSSPFHDFGFAESTSKNHTLLAPATSSDAMCSTCAHAPGLLLTSCSSCKKQSTESEKESKPDPSLAQGNLASPHQLPLPQQQAHQKTPTLPRASARPSPPRNHKPNPHQAPQTQHAFPTRTTSLGSPPPSSPPSPPIHHHHRNGKP
ncbi:hypothetical protein AOQ84DRAFT_223094, partial [Glonium stellatum]